MAGRVVVTCLVEPQKQAASRAEVSYLLEAAEAGWKQCQQQRGGGPEGCVGSCTGSSK
jgi:hypothetical protein